LMRKKKQAR